MIVPDQALKMALADAIDGQRVLFLTPTQMITSALVEHALEVSYKTIGYHLFREGTSPWHLLTSKGWIFFFPVDDLNPDEDVSNPHLVYYPDNRDYVRVTYKAWLTPTVSHKNTMWDRISE